MSWPHDGLPRFVVRILHGPATSAAKPGGPCGAVVLDRAYCHSTVAEYSSSRLGNLGRMQAVRLAEQHAERLNHTRRGRVSAVKASRSAPRRPRAEWVAEANRLRGEGLNVLEIAQTLGLSRQFVYDLFNDPDGAKAKARKQRYAGVCVDCGKPTSGGEGRKKEPRCRGCATPRTWSREILIERIREWAWLYGQPPAAYEWNPNLARRVGYDHAADLFEDDPHWPSYGTVTHHFGSWADAIEAAGFTRPKPGFYRSER